MTVNFQVIFDFTDLRSFPLPSYIAELLLKSLDDLDSGITPENLIMFSQLNTRLKRFRIHGNRIQNPNLLFFLRKHPIEVLELRNFPAISSVKDLRYFVNVKKLKQLAFSNRLNCRFPNFKFYKKFVSLTKLDVSYSGFDNTALNIVCCSMPNLEEFNMDQTKVNFIDYLTELKKLRVFIYFHTFTNKKLSTKEFLILKNLKSLDELTIKFLDNSIFIVFYHFFLESDWQIKKLRIYMTNPEINVKFLTRE